MKKRHRLPIILLTLLFLSNNGSTLIAQQSSETYLPLTLTDPPLTVELKSLYDSFEGTVQSAQLRNGKLSLILETIPGKSLPSWITEETKIDSLKNGRLLQVRIPYSQLRKVTYSDNSAIRRAFVEGPKTEVRLPAVMRELKSFDEHEADELKVYFGSGSSKWKKKLANMVIEKKDLPQIKESWRSWHFDRIGLSKAHRIATGKGIIVAVLDTGVSIGHNDLAGHINRSMDLDFVGDDHRAGDGQNNLDDDGDGLVDEGAGHGTHVAGIIASIAPDAKILPIRVLNSDGRGQLWDIVKGIYYAVDSGAHIINMSFRIRHHHPLFEAALQYANENGVLVVAAAGNGGRHIAYPAKYSHVTSVGATDSKDNVTDFSRGYRNGVDIFAPGELVFSTFRGDRYAFLSGSSMAAPFVSGLYALMGERALALNNMRVRNTLARQTIKSTIENNELVMKDVSPRPSKGRGRLHINQTLKRMK